MAAGDITVGVSISGTLSNGQAIASVSHSKVFSSIAAVFDRTLAADVTVQTLLTIGALAAGAQLVTLNFFYLKNLDATNAVMLGFIDTGAEAFYVEVGPGESFLYEAGKLEANATGGAFAAFADVDTITLDAAAGAPVCHCIAG